MRYTVAEYKNILEDKSVPFGIILQNGGGVEYRFDLSQERFSKVQDISPTADFDTFSNFERTFKENFVDKGSITTTDDAGGKKVINITNQSFLDYLSEKFQNVYQFQKPRELQVTEKQKALRTIFEYLVLGQKPEGVDDETVKQISLLP